MTWKVAPWNEAWLAPYREDGKTSTVRLVADEHGEAVAIAVTCYGGWSNAKKDAELDANARAISATPEALALAQRIANLNPNCTEIGAGMLASLVSDAQAVLKKAGTK